MANTKPASAAGFKNVTARDTRSNPNNKTLPSTETRLKKAGDFSSLINFLCVRFPLQLRQNDPGLLLVFAGFVSVADFAGFIALEEKNLAEAFIGINFGRQRRAVGDL